MERPVQELGALLHAASTRLSTLGDRVLKPLNVTSAQWKVLVVLARRGDLRVSVIVETLQHDQAAVSRLVTRMQRAGLVRRLDDPGDARAGVVQLTAKGRATYQQCEARLRAVMDGLEHSLSPDERVRIKALLVRLTAAIDEALTQWPVQSGA